MALYLVQHGKSLSKDMDPERGLSEEGRAETKRIAEVAAGYHVNVRSIQHSGKKRARETAEIFHALLGPGAGFEEITGLNPLDDVSTMAERITDREDMMLVGHLPFMEKLTALLITGKEDKPVFRFQNSGIVCLDQDETSGFWAIKWALMPNIG